MRFVLLALSRPLTIVIALIAIALASILAIRRMPVDIFPQVGDPAIYVAQPHSGMDPAQMEGFLTYYMRITSCTSQELTMSKVRAFRAPP
jgi:multidrug efflux pump subunit AcrB